MAEILGRSGRTAMSPSVSSTRRYASASVRLAIALMGLIAILLAACGPDSGSGPTLAKNQTFTWPYWGTAQIQHGEDLDPAIVASYEDLGTLDMIYAGLVTVNSQMQVEADAATWTVDSTGTIYTFSLKHNMHFSDGTPLTAADYAYSIDRALDPNLCSPTNGLDAKTYGAQGTNTCQQLAAAHLFMILGADKRLAGTINSVIGTGDDQTHGVDVVDPYTLKIRLEKPTPYFLESLTYPTSFPVERSLVQKYPGGLWVDHLDQGGCSGPFKIASYGGGKELKLVANTYWETAFRNLTLTEVDRPAFDTIDDEYRQYNTAGQFDYTDVPPEDYSLAHSQDDFNEVPTLTTLYYGLNFDKPPFDSLLVRRAFDLALNKQILVDRVFDGAASPTNHIIPLGMPGFFPSLVNPPPDGTQSLTGNPTAAQQLITQALQQGNCSSVTPADYCPYIDNGPSSQEIDFMYDSTTQTDRDMTTASANSWASALKLNVKAVPSNLPQGQYFGAIYSFPVVTSYHAWSIGWIADYPDPQDWTTLQFCHSCGPNPNNTSDVNDPSLDKLMQAADEDLNPTDRMAKYNQIEQDLINLVPWIPYAQLKSLWRQRSWVHGFGLNALGTMIDLNWPNVYITQH